jgi:hypothetical protein
MNQPSITSTATFALRAQRSEATRMTLWGAVLAGMLLLTLIRRWMGGIVMSHDAVFYPYVGVLALGLIGQLAVLPVVRNANRRGALLPGWLWRASSTFDLAIAATLLIIVVFRSPRGSAAALTAPPILLFPLLVLMSVLRLRPDLTLRTGLVAAAIHLLLAVKVAMSGAAPEAYPVYFAYGFILILTAIVGTFVAKQVRQHVREAADESAAHERSERQVFGMQRDLSVARDIQRGLLPTRSPALKGFDIIGMNRPADQTGGDYCDWQALPDGKVAVALADVAGHGIGPALVMAVCRAYARDRLDDPRSRCPAHAAQRAAARRPPERSLHHVRPRRSR